MERARTWTAFSLIPLAAGAFLALGGHLAPTARAEVPSGTPVFSNPTEFSNEFFPFEVGGYRVFSGRSEGAPVVIIDVFSAGTRDIPWNGGTVTCRILQETEFEDGALVEISQNYFAQADDGSVYYFGEIVDDYEDGVVVDHGGSWIVGGPTGSDPEGTQSTGDPALFMPADPEVGDEWMPEDVPDGPQELDVCTREDVRVKVRAGRYEGCIEVTEQDLGDDGTEKKWYAPGIGVCKGRQKGETFALVATTFLPSEDE